MLDDIFIENCPKLDLHGENRASTRVLLKEFINDNYILKNCRVVIVHGIGTGILKNEVHEILKDNKLVEDFHLSRYNIGCTIVYIKKKD